jgi:putative acetyltransferase
MDIKTGGLQKTEVILLLQEHKNNMHLHSPAESVHALDLSDLKTSDITFWSVWINNELAGCGALKELNKNHGEIKSMRTSINHLRKGVADNLLNHILKEATKRSYKEVSLETGTMDVFLPAQQLYKKYGFYTCAAFGNYTEDPYSTFMTKILE